MKIITNILILSTLILSQIVLAQQICKSYITDDWPVTRYIVKTISGDNVVIDNKTGLMWKQCSEGLTGSDCSTGNLSSHTWQQALDLTNAGDFAGYTDWRVPNKKELRTLAVSNCYNPSINISVFPNTASWRYWSSSPMAFYVNQAWPVGFHSGGVRRDFRTIDYHVRLVRSL